MPTRVYEYGLLPPTTNAKLVDEQISAAHRYRNVLTEIEIERRNKVREALSSHPDVEPLETRLKEIRDQRDQLRNQIKLARAKTRSRSESTEQRTRVKELSAELGKLVENLKATRKAITEDPMVQAKIAEAAEHARARRREERGKTPTFWGTYLLAEADADAASKGATPPKFQRWTGEGRVSVQVQGGISPAELFGGKERRVQVDPVPEDTWGGTIGLRRRQGKTKLRLRIGSQGRDPIWAEWPMMLHRPLPANGTIKVATVSRVRRDCRTWYWRVHFTVELPDGWTAGQSGEGVCALNLGWAQHENGLIRAGYVIGESGPHGVITVDDHHEILVPRSVVDRVEKSESIRSIRDKNLDEMRPRLVAWFAAMESLLDLWPENIERPEWHKHIPTLHAWRSARRFRALAFAWRTARFHGDDAGYDIIESWRYRDEHLERYESGLLRGALFHRREVYRLVAAKLAARYHTLVIDTFDLRDTQKSPKPEEARTEISVVKRNQRHAAGSELRYALVNAFTRVGGRVVKLAAENVTRTCHACGELNEWDRTDGERMHTCAGCGALWDQDGNACRNLLRRYRVEQHNETTPDAKKEGRSDRLRRARQRKSAETSSTV